jgi:hypothetical protein
MWYYHFKARVRAGVTSSLTRSGGFLIIPSVVRSHRRVKIYNHGHDYPRLSGRLCYSSG